MFSAVQPVASISLLRLLAAALAAFLVAAFGNVVNDIQDTAIDAVNRPDRPIPSGAISGRCAGYYGLLLLSAGLGVSYLASLAHFAFACCVAALLIAYANWFKASVLLGNIIVSLLTGATLVYGGLLASHWQLSLVPAFFAFLINFSREIIKDAEDVAGDAQNNIVTFPVRFGARAGQKLAALPLVLLSVLVFVPFRMSLYGTLYCIIVAIGVSLPLLFVSFLLFSRDCSQEVLHRISMVLKLVMLIGILAILFGRDVCEFVFSA